MLFRDDLHDYQRRAVEFILEKKRCALFLEMGLGKSVSSLTAISDLIDGFAVHKVLVVAPLRVANSVWKQEARRWQHLQHLEVAVCTGTARQRLSALQSDADVYVINRENVVWLQEHYGKRWPFDCVIIDESSSFKSPSSQRFKALRKVIPHTEYMVLLTGTPSPNGLLDLWSQVFLVDFGASLGRTMTMYKSRFFESDYMGYKFSPRAGSADKIHELIRPFTLSMRSEDYLDLPDRIDLEEVIDLPAKVLREYQEFERDLFIELDAGEEIEAKSAAVLANKLLQYANGALYTDTHGSWAKVHDLKIDTLRELVEQNEGENILVAYNYKSDLERLKKAFPDAVQLGKDADIIDRWNDGEISMLLAHPACLHPMTEVLTESRGWVRIIDVRSDERVFDGLEFVSHKGCHFSGIRPVISKLGITLTPNHKLLIGDVWVEARNVSNHRNIRRKARYTYTGNDNYLSEMLPLRGCISASFAECKACKQAGAEALCRVPPGNISQHDEHSILGHLASHAKQGVKSIRRGLSKVWCDGTGRIRRMDGFQKLLRRHVSDVQRRPHLGPNRQRKRLQQRELPMGHKHAATSQQIKQSDVELPSCGYAPCGILPSGWCEQRRNHAEAGQRDESRGSFGRLSEFKLQEKQKVSEVYDLVDCGPRNRFLIRNDQGEVFISHNSAGHGLNLQRGGAIAVWFGLNWSLENYQQFNARLHRQGQERPVRIVHLVAKSTIDERVMQVLADKGATQDSLLNALKPRE